MYEEFHATQLIGAQIMWEKFYATLPIPSWKITQHYTRIVKAWIDKVQASVIVLHIEIEGGGSSSTIAREEFLIVEAANHKFP